MHPATMGRRSFLAAAGAAGLAAAAGCGDVSGVDPRLDRVTPGASGRPSRGGVLRYGLSTDPVNFDPHVSTGTASDAVRQMMYNTLLQYDADGRIVGDLAAEHGWTSPTTYEVRLRDGVRFHDGSVLTAEDVAFTYERMKDPDTTATVGPFLAELDRVDPVSRTTAVFRLSEPNAALPAILASVSANIVSKRWIESGVDPKTHVMGTGPFRFAGRVPGVSTMMERFDEYFEPGLPYLNGIQFVPMPDDYARVMALRSAAVDMIDYVPLTHVDAIRRNPRLRLYADATIGFGYIAFINDRPPFDDVRVRKAIGYALDRTEMLRTAYLGHGSPVTGGMLPKGFPGASTDLDGTYGYDPDRTRALLRQAGVGHLAVDMLATSTYSVHSRPAEAALPSLRRAGIDAGLTRLEWPSYLAVQMAHKYAVRYGGGNLLYGDPDALRNFVGSNGTYAQYMNFSDDRVDALLAAGRRARDPGKRAEIYHDLEKRVLDRAPWTYTLKRDQAEAARTNVRGYAHPPTGTWTSVALRRTWLEERT